MQILAGPKNDTKRNKLRLVIEVQTLGFNSRGLTKLLHYYYYP